jgi:hypothetical protein
MKRGLYSLFHGHIEMCWGQYGGRKSIGEVQTGFLYLNYSKIFG